MVWVCRVGFLQPGGILGWRGYRWNDRRNGSTKRNHVLRQLLGCSQWRSGVRTIIPIART